MSLKRIKKEIIRELADAVRTQSFKHPIRHTKAVSSALRDRLKSGKPLSQIEKKLLLASATGPATYATMAAGGGALGLKGLMDKKASVFDSFYDELNKIASLSPTLSRYVSQARTNPIAALKSMSSDKPAQAEELTIIRQLRKEGRLPKSLSTAPIPKGQSATLGEKAKGLRWASRNLANPQVRSDLRAVLASLG